MRTENGEFEISTYKLKDGTITLDFRTQPRMEEVDGFLTVKAGTGYGSFHFQLSPKDAVKVGKLLGEVGKE